MKEPKIHFVTILIAIISIGLTLAACGKQETKQESKTETKTTDGNKTNSNISHKIEFVELGSVNCIPCRQMQPVMSSIEKKYKGLVKVTFFDVWKDNAPAKKYGIDLIPTQVFLDSQGKEITRHQGFYAEEEIDKFLQSQGLNIPD